MGVVYRPPNQSVQSFNEALENVHIILSVEKEHCYISVGDFNISGPDVMSMP